MKRYTHFIPALLLCIIFCLLETQVNAQVINTIAGKHSYGYSGDNGPATSAELFFPAAISFDGLGNYYIADEGNNVIRKVNSSGIITTIAGNGFGAGTGSGGYTGDGGPATLATLFDPSDVTFDAAGNLYIADNHNYVVRKVNMAGIISTLVGCGLAGYSGDGAAANLAKLSAVTGVRVDITGNLYVADQHNNVIRKVDITGNISTFAGTGVMGFSGDGGPATNATFAYPTSIAIDKYANLYISDQDNNCIRKVDVSGRISTVAGTGALGYGGDGGPATSALLNNAVGIDIDTSSTLFISDQANHLIRKVKSTGIITSIAGTMGVNGYSGDNGPATSCKLNRPWGVKVDGTENLFIADYFNHAVRKITVSDPEKAIETLLPNISVSPNPATAQFTITNATGALVTIINTIGSGVKVRQCTSTKETIDISALPSGIYFVQVQTKEGERKNIRLIKN